uniref:Uncharacterized protein n=1 Tax=Romanomermis culicivorax TaxID=13658 RepID=A0A915HP91_ROMCU
MLRARFDFRKQLSRVENRSYCNSYRPQIKPLSNPPLIVLLNHPPYYPFHCMSFRPSIQDKGTPILTLLALSTFSKGPHGLDDYFIYRCVDLYFVPVACLMPSGTLIPIGYHSSIIA